MRSKFREIKGSFLFIVGLFAIVIVFSLEAYAQSARTKQIQFSWTFKYTRFPGKITIYEVDSDKIYDIGETKSTPLNQANPYTKQAPNLIPIRPNVMKPMALVIENPTDQPWYFYANFHAYVPIDNAAGITLQCLCNNSIFEVPAKSRWSRIVNTRAKKLVQGDKLHIEHEVIGLTQDEVRKKNLENILNKGL